MAAITSASSAWKAIGRILRIVSFLALEAALTLGKNLLGPQHLFRNKNTITVANLDYAVNMF
ncbi:hypothetical protein [Methylobacterium frigidaeris]|uniref:Uncharacterized protein n=1 Tax=Methylobacterium frigidaeris TaxID=2038277 RepID=A0AA37HHC6_9HYPH|nr:hypothetical protein [Methylobacterium frigidaeris]GJD65960.1 hypothetical protein MPEAHAMD_6156 [Methylobacterium frigidaeris]